MPFGIGGSSSSSRSRSDSSSFDNTDSFGFDLGVSGSSSGSVSGGRSQDSIAFEDIFADLFGGASAAAGRVDTGGLTDAANSLFNRGGSFLDRLSGGGAGGAFLEERLASRDGLADEQIGLLGQDIEKFLTESVLPGIDSTGISAGTLGGSRGEVQRGIASEGALREFARGSSSIRSNEQAQRDSIARDLMANNTQASGIGLGSLEGLFGLAEGGALAELSPFAALSSILGGPTVLNSSSNESSALAEAFGFDLGMDSTTGRAGSTSSSRSRSSSSGFNLGF